MLFAMFGGSISIADTDTLTFGKNLTVEVGIPTASDIALLYDDNHTMTHAPLTKTDQEHKAIQNMDQALDTNTIVHELSDEHTGDDLGEDVGSAFSIDDIINDQVNRVTPDLITPHSETKITDISFKRALNNGSVISFNWKQENAEIHFSDAKNTLLITFSMRKLTKIGCIALMPLYLIRLSIRLILLRLEIILKLFYIWGRRLVMNIKSLLTG